MVYNLLALNLGQGSIDLKNAKYVSKRTFKKKAKTELRIEGGKLKCARALKKQMFQRFQIHNRWTMVSFSSTG